MTTKAAPCNNILDPAFASSSADTLVRTLRSPHYPFGDRACLAKRLLEAPASTVHLPRKRDFLLEWCSTTMAKAGPKASEPRPRLQPAFWALLLHTLSSPNSPAPPSDPTQPPSSGGEHTLPDRRGNPLASVKTPLLGIISATLQDLADQTNESLDSGSRLALLSHLHDTCHLLLISKPLSSYHHASLDHLSSSLSAILLSTHHSLSHTPLDPQSSPILLSTLHIIARAFLSHLRLMSNPRKLFSLAVDHFLLPFLSILGPVTGPLIPDSTRDLLRQILQSSLFPSDQLSDFSTIMTADPTGRIQPAKDKDRTIISYQKHLFTTLRKAWSSSPSPPSSLVEGLSLLLDIFIQAASQGNPHDLSSPPNPDHSTINRSLIFSFYLELASIASDHVQCRTRLIQTMARTRAYRPSQDKAGRKQSSILRKDILHHWIPLAHSTSDPLVLSHILETLAGFVELDDRLLEDSPQAHASLISSLLHAPSPAGSGAKILLDQLVHASISARSFPSLLTHLIHGVQESSSSVNPTCFMHSTTCSEG